jgi:hypothetical protein
MKAITPLPTTQYLTEQPAPITVVDSQPISSCGVPEAAGAVIRAFNEKLLSITRAQAVFGFSRTSFWRFRIRHRIHTLPGQRVNIDDILSGFEADRHGQRRAA